MREIIIPPPEEAILIVDDEDYEAALRLNFRYKIDSRTISYLVRKLTNCPKGKQVDHINGNLLDNRKENLRVCDYVENIRNRGSFQNTSSYYKGVSFKGGKWCAAHKDKHIGMFGSEIGAAIAYDTYVSQLYPDCPYTYLNFPQRGGILNEV